MTTSPNTTKSAMICNRIMFVDDTNLGSVSGNILVVRVCTYVLFSTECVKKGASVKKVEPIVLPFMKRCKLQVIIIVITTAVVQGFLLVKSVLFSA